VASLFPPFQSWIGGNRKKPWGNVADKPLHLQVMTDPVLLIASGQTYDRASLRRWFAAQVSSDGETKWLLPNFHHREIPDALTRERFGKAGCL
jgi:hypothetical protein